VFFLTQKSTVVGCSTLLSTLADRRSGEIRTKIGHHTAEEAVALYRIDLIAGSLPFTIDDARRKLKGEYLICWCKPGAPCHADVLTFIPKGNANPSR
jgi:hypothetical protein